MKIKLSHLVVTLLLSLIIQGCGFKLQGNYQLPNNLKQLKLQSSDQYGELTRLVTTKLRRYQVALIDDPSLPILKLSSDSLTSSTLSLFSSGQVAEYELTYSVNYQLILPRQPPQQFSIQMRRDYLDDPQSAQAKSREMALIKTEMRAQAAEQIVRQLSRIKQVN
ncbi:MAG: hypothetical protein HRU23_16395 [Gammaproteobacteria bacterium]|nr:hypothetical protein [Gammaproteobacteria bacterium]